MKNWKHLPLMIAVAVIIAVQLLCTYGLILEGRRNYAAQVIETFKACKGYFDPWEPYPWDKK